MLLGLRLDQTDVVAVVSRQQLLQRPKLHCFLDERGGVDRFASVELRWAGSVRLSASC